MQRRNVLGRARVLRASAPAGVRAQATSYPAKPVRVIVAFTAGGTTDILARAVSQKLSESLKQSFVIDNKPGAGGNLGTEFVVRSPPDGYTLIVNSVGPMAVNKTLFKSLPYDPLVDLVPVVQIADVPNVLVVPPELPAKTLEEFIAHAKANPNKLSYGSTGVGTSSHLSSFMLSKRIGAETQHIPYKGADALERPARRPHPVHVRHHPVGDRLHQGRAGCARSPSAARSARARCPTFRPSPRRASRASRPGRGSASSRPRARRLPHRDHQQGGQRGPALARGAADPRRRRSGRRQRRAVRRVHAAGIREVAAIVRESGATVE